MVRSNDLSEPYLPERYRQKIRNKQRSRLLKKILTGILAVTIAAIVLVVLFGYLSTPQLRMPVPATETPVSPTSTTGSTLSPATPAVTVTPVLTPATTRSYSIASGVPVTGTGSSLTLDNAVVALRDYYPENDYMIRSVNYSVGSDRSLFGFELVPKETLTGSSPFIVFIEAATGKPWAPDAETAAITRSQAEGIAVAAFPSLTPDTKKIWYSSNPVHGAVWQFLFSSGSLPLVSGSINAETGDLISFSRHILASGRKTIPSVGEDTTREKALQFITEKNNGATLPLNLTSVKYNAWGTPSVPAAGAYTFFFERSYHNYPVDTDSVVVAVDAETGDVITYDILWSTQDYAFSQTSETTIVQRDAIFAVMQAAKNRLPESVESVQIISSELRWNNQHSPGFTQRPGSVPLEWKITFSDDTIRANSSLSPAVAWVNIQTGNVTSLNYQH